MKKTIHILGIALVSLVVSCTQKDKNPEVEMNPKTDPMAIQAPLDSTKTNSVAGSDNSENSVFDINKSKLLTELTKDINVNFEYFLDKQTEKFVVKINNNKVILF